MPSVDTQVRLLQLFQDFAHASFPVLDFGQLWTVFNSM